MRLSLYRYMKKGLFAISFIFYFAVTSGVVINSHYCMKKLVSIHLFEKKAKICARCGMGMHNNSGCCRDEVKLVKLTQDQNKDVFSNPGIAKLSPVVAVPSSFIESPFVQLWAKPHFHNYSPPLLSAQDTYLLNNVFRI